jgi:hypothetical protein
MTNYKENMEKNIKVIIAGWFGFNKVSITKKNQIRNIWNL